MRLLCKQGRVTLTEMQHPAQCGSCIQVPSAGMIASAPTTQTSLWSYKSHLSRRRHLTTFLTGIAFQSCCQSATANTADMTVIPILPLQDSPTVIPKQRAMSSLLSWAKEVEEKFLRAVVLDGSGRTVALNSIFLDQYDQREKTETNLDLHKALKDQEITSCL